MVLEIEEEIVAMGRAQLILENNQITKAVTHMHPF